MTVHFSDPREAVLQLGLREGMKVADIGSGTGQYARAASAVVGLGGKVYAIDIQEDLLRHATGHQGHLHAHHRDGTTEVMWGDAEKAGGTGLRDGSVDAVIVANLVFQVENRFGLLSEIKRIIKPEGRMLVVDWAGAYGGMGPSSDRVIPEHHMEEFFINGGFHKMKSFRADPHHYGIVFTAP